MVALHGRVEAALAEAGLPRGASAVSGPSDGRPGPRRRERNSRPFSLWPKGVRREGDRSSDEGILELGKLVQLQSDFAAGSMTVDKVAVFSSTLTSDGPVYEKIGSSSLGGKT